MPLLTGNHATDPIIPPLRATVAPVPRPEKSPVALAERPDGLVLVIHPGTVAYEILPATIEAMQADHFEQLTTWFKAWGHGRVPPLEFIVHYERYCSHQLGIVVVSDLVIPPPVRLLN